MKRLNRGFSLIELLITLALGLIVMLGVVRIFISAKNTYVSQNGAAAMQEDARFVLSKMIQEIRMVGMFGCLGTITDSSTAGDFNAVQITPISWDNANLKLTLVTADIGSGGGTPTWTVVSDCRNSATAYTGSRTPATGQIAFPIRRLVYSFSNNQILMGTGSGTPTQAALVSNVSAFNVTFGLAASATDVAATTYSSNPGDPARIRSVRLSLTLTDPNNRVATQTFNVVAAVRNRLQ
ncbi:prepilin-type N-terminal cleavage/methylation domain-containing protein [Pseudomonas sp. B2M1-30]|uniref:Prepilin-type N-terminal cleavage/methylation domain-containing protein n=1 Tax=Pseudomonas koreensis TaxID=198620 RepID=A0A9X2XH70_9PSED|nr:MULTISPECIES: prepilin-type N-terminal cleavage/methylation domain-containing protein [Pseudomonas]MBV4473683.1 prepilin-type N-terminal cleavage/methylation domain-containing protein [Pseudomonas botevensis]MCU0121971.1 prepilin-type N-terminal cleavage/methylation domain-containing protein [Pseudomonas sp. B2M1-30]MCU7249099.1 prepilin-type N-terminal cleavage/methylation domain-containing protein [Pseudomonas koreensis]MCU7260792.1 prepilin-type N-terminal cleavage/methylation domain-cont